MLTAFDKSLAFVLRWEGGLSKDAKDRAATNAGEVHTAYGITQDTYTDWRLMKGDLPQPVALIEDSEVGEVYLDLYWKKVRGDDLANIPAQKLALCVFDAAVQHGVGTASSMLQRTVRVEADGIIGRRTLEATALRVRMASEGAVIESYLDRRRGLYASLIIRDPSQGRFKKGWANRLNDLSKEVGVDPAWPA